MADNETKYIGTEALGHVFSLLKGQFAQYAKTSDVSGTYATTALLNSTKETLEARDTAIEAKIPTDYITSNYLTTNYLTKDDISNQYVTLGTIKSEYVSSEELNSELGLYTTTEKLEKNYAKKSETVTSVNGATGAVTVEPTFLFSATYNSDGSVTCNTGYDEIWGRVGTCDVWMRLTTGSGDYYLPLVSAIAGVGLSFMTVTDTRLFYRLTCTNDDNWSGVAGDFATVDYVNNKISQISGMTYAGPYASVSALPSEGAAGTIYLVTQRETEKDIYDEYIWFESKYELIGTTAVDLSEYIKARDALNTFATQSNTYTKTETNTAITNGVPITAIKTEDNQTLSPSSKVVTLPLATTSKAGLMSKDDKTNLNTFTSNTRGYITTSALSGYATTGNVTSAVSSHNTATDAHSDIRAAIPTLKEMSNEDVTSVWNTATA